VTAHLPPSGLPVDEVLSRLEGLRANDVAWREGRAFSLAYVADDDTMGLAAEAYRRFSGENALNTDAFPSLRRMQNDVVGIVSGWLGSPEGAAGVFTSGGTESLLLAVKAARDQFAAQRGTALPNVVLPASAHAAFSKACHYFGVEARRVPVRDDWRADPDAMRAACDENTVLVVASAPQYPQGVIDDVPAIAALARDLGANCHVDACMGGVTLPYLARLGESVPPWNFEVPGVTSVSVDLHKFGYASKGAGVVVYRTKELRGWQHYVTDDWLGGLYGSSGLLGTKSGGPIAAAWAVLHHLGDEGYLRLTAAARRATLAIAEAITATPGLVLRAQPETTLLAFGAVDPDALDVFAVADELKRRGWYVDRQVPPPSLHLTVNAVHDGIVSEFRRDIQEAVMAVGSKRGESGAYSTF
jgi:sphinganine-1-phosphate aldolase